MESLVVRLLNRQTNHSAVKLNQSRRFKMNTFILIVGSVLALLWATNEILVGFAKEAERQCEKRRKR